MPVESKMDSTVEDMKKIKTVSPRKHVDAGSIKNLRKRMINSTRVAVKPSAQPNLLNYQATQKSLIHY